VRLMLVLAPAACCLAGVALHQLLLTLARSVNAGPARGPVEAPSPARDAAPRKPSKLGKVRRLARGSALSAPGVRPRCRIQRRIVRPLATHTSLSALRRTRRSSPRTPADTAGSTCGRLRLRSRPRASPLSRRQQDLVQPDKPRPLQAVV